MRGILEILFLNIPEAIIIISLMLLILGRATYSYIVLINIVFMGTLTYAVQSYFDYNYLAQIIVIVFYIFTVKIMHFDIKILYVILSCFLTIFIFLIIELSLCLVILFIVGMTIVEMQSSLYTLIIISIPIRLIEFIFITFVKEEFYDIKQSLNHKFRRN